MNEDKHLEIRIRMSMFGRFRFSHMSDMLSECSATERSEASTALNARTRVREKKIWQLALPKPERCLLRFHSTAPYSEIYKSDTRRVAIQNILKRQ